MKKTILCLAAVISFSAHADLTFPIVMMLSTKEEAPAVDGAKKMIVQAKSIPWIFRGEFISKGKNCSDQNVVHLNVTKSNFEIDKPDLQKIKCTVKGAVTAHGNEATFNAVCESKVGKESNVFTLKKDISVIELNNVSTKQSEGLFISCKQ